MSLRLWRCLWLAGLLMLPLGAAWGEILTPPSADDLPVKLVKVSAKDFSFMMPRVRYTWTYEGEPGQAFCVAFATSERADIVDNDLGGRAHSGDAYGCATVDSSGRAHVEVSVSDRPSGLLIGTMLMKDGVYHTDVYRMSPKE